MALGRGRGSPAKLPAGGPACCKTSQAAFPIHYPAKGRGRWKPAERAGSWRQESMIGERICAAAEPAAVLKGSSQPPPRATTAFGIRGPDARRRELQVRDGARILTGGWISKKDAEPRTAHTAPRLAPLADPRSRHGPPRWNTARLGSRRLAGLRRMWAEDGTNGEVCSYQDGRRRACGIDGFARIARHPRTGRAASAIHGGLSETPPASLAFGGPGA